MKYRLTNNVLGIACIIMLSANSVAVGSSFLKTDDVQESHSHNCRFWGMLAPRSFNATSVRNHLDFLQSLGSGNHDGWGIGFYTQTIKSEERIPVIFRGGWSAPNDCRYDTAANVLIRNIVNSGVAHVRAVGGSEVKGVPNPHPFYTQGIYRDFDMLFAHNGVLDIAILHDLLGTYADTNHWDYFRHPDTLDPNHDTDLYRLYLMQWIDHHPRDGITQCLEDALNYLISQMGSGYTYNFVLASKYDTLWALRYNQSLYRRYVGPTDPGVWEVASQPLGGGGWVGTTNHYLYVFTPSSAVPDSFEIDSDEESSSPGGQKDGASEMNHVSIKSCRAYPNPIDKTFNIEFEMKDRLFVLAKLYDITGRFVDNVYSGVARKGFNHFSYDVSSLPSGIYFVRLETEDCQITERLIIQR